MKTFPINVNRTNEMNVGNAEPLRWITKTRAVPRTALLLYIGDSKPTVKKMLPKDLKRFFAILFLRMRALLNIMISLLRRLNIP